MHKIFKIMFCISMCSIVGAAEHHASKPPHYHSDSYTRTLTTQGKVPQLVGSRSSNANGIRAVTLTSKQTKKPATIVMFFQQNTMGIVLGVSALVILGIVLATSNSKLTLKSSKQVIAASAPVPAEVSIGLQPLKKQVYKFFSDRIASKGGSASVDNKESKSSSLRPKSKDGSQLSAAPLVSAAAGASQLNVNQPKAIVNPAQSMANAALEAATPAATPLKFTPPVRAVAKAAQVKKSATAPKVKAVATAAQVNKSAGLRPLKNVVLRLFDNPLDELADKTNISVDQANVATAQVNKSAGLRPLKNVVLRLFDNQLNELADKTNIAAAQARIAKRLMKPKLRLRKPDFLRLLKLKLLRLKPITLD